MYLPRNAGTPVLAALLVIQFSIAGVGQAPQGLAARAERATERLADLAARFQAGERAPGAAAALADAAAERAGLIQALMETDPGTVLRLAVAPDVRNGLPADVQPHVEEHVTVEGEVTVFYEDYEHHSRLLHVLQTARERLSLRIAGTAPDLQSDQRIRVRGVKLGDNLAADGGTIIPVTSALPNTFGEQRTLMILITFADSTNPPYTVAAAQQLLFGTVSDFMRENSQNQTWLTGDVAGWYPTTLSRTTCDSTAIGNAARQAASAAGYNLANYRRFIYGFPSNSCGWWGLGQVGGSTTHAWINGSIATRVVAHELGHNLGVYHALALECGTTTLGSNCSTIEYGNPADIMGVSGTVAHFNAFKKERMGWLNYGSSAPLLTITGSGTYSIEPYAMTGTGIKGLKILKSTNPTTGRRTFYYVEYRGGGYGFDSTLRNNTAMQNGVMITIGTEANGNSSFALDMTPETSPWTDAPLPVGRTFSDPDAGVNITPIAANSSGATVMVDFGPTCGYTVSPLSLSVGGGAGSGSATVTADASCVWAAASNAAWIGITGGSSGTGNGTTSFSIAANLSGNSRTGTLTVAGHVVTVTQAPGCSFAVAPTTMSVMSDAGAAGVGVTTTPGCPWTAASGSSWITVTGGSGTGSGTAGFTFSRNSSPNARTGSLTVAGRTVTVTQAGRNEVCTFSVSPTSQAVAAGGATGSATVTTAVGCAWTAISNVPWITVTGPGSGSGSGSTSYAVAANASTAPRTGTLTIAAQTLTVTQAATIQSVTTVSALTSSSASPLIVGTPVTWTATGSNTLGPVEYQFWMYRRTAWSMVQAYGPANTFTWTPQPADVGAPYHLQVWARAVGSTASYEAWRSSPTYEVVPPPLTLAANVDFPTPPGNTVTWTASVTSPGTLEYRFFVRDENTGASTQLRAYSPDHRVQWTPQAAGRYVVSAWARPIGSSQEFEMSASTPPLDVVATPLTVKSLLASVPFPARTGTPISWTARVQGGLAGPIQYQFWLYSAQTGTWRNVQPYGPSETWTWTPVPGEEGAYSLQVWVRSAGSTAVYEHWRSSPTFQIEPASLASSADTGPRGH